MDYWLTLLFLYVITGVNLLFKQVCRLQIVCLLNNLLVFVVVIIVMSLKIELTLATGLYHSYFVFISNLMVIVRVINHFCHFKSILRLLLLHHLRSNDKKDFTYS